MQAKRQKTIEYDSKVNKFPKLRPDKIASPTSHLESVALKNETVKIQQDFNTTKQAKIRRGSLVRKRLFSGDYDEDGGFAEIPPSAKKVKIDSKVTQSENVDKAPKISEFKDLLDKIAQENVSGFNALRTIEKVIGKEVFSTLRALFVESLAVKSDDKEKSPKRPEQPTVTKSLVQCSYVTSSSGSRKRKRMKLSEVDRLNIEAMNFFAIEGCLPALKLRNRKTISYTDAAFPDLESEEADEHHVELSMLLPPESEKEFERSSKRSPPKLKSCHVVLEKIDSMFSFDVPLKVNNYRKLSTSPDNTNSSLESSLSKVSKNIKSEFVEESQSIKVIMIYDDDDARERIPLSRIMTADDDNLLNKPYIESPESPEPAEQGDEAVAESSSNRVVIKRLRPWINGRERKTPFNLNRMVQEDCLVNMFKCMGKGCDFNCNGVRQFFKHLQDHNATDESSINIGKCCYCKFMSPNIPDLLEHITETHKIEKFCCNKCFYRSVSHLNVQVHQKLHHDDESAVVLECSLKKTIT